MNTDYEHLARLATAATPGPWDAEDVYALVAPTKIDGFVYPAARLEAERRAALNAEFIAAANPATVLRLIEESRGMAARLSAVESLHQRLHRPECGARLTTTVEHSRNITSEVRLHCTKEAGHEGKHRDAICCWTFHTFDDAESFEPRDLDLCKHCGTAWPCPTGAILQEVNQ